MARTTHPKINTDFDLPIPLTIYAVSPSLGADFRPTLILKSSVRAGYTSQAPAMKSRRVSPLFVHQYPSHISPDEDPDPRSAPPPEPSPPEPHSPAHAAGKAQKDNPLPIPAYFFALTMATWAAPGRGGIDGSMLTKRSYPTSHPCL